MKKNFTLLTLAGAFLSVHSQDIRLVSDSGSLVTLSNFSKPFTAHAKLVDGKTYQDFSQASKVLMMQKDAPALPVYTESIIVPNQGNVSVMVEYGAFDEFDNIEVLPSKGSLKRNVNPSDIPYVFGQAYQQDAFFPGELASMSSPYVMRNKRGVTIAFYPYQYNPVTKKLRVYRDIQVKVATDAAIAGINELKSGSLSTSAFNQIYQSTFLNANNYQQVPENGEMLIIAPATFINMVEPLADWKIQRGIKTTIVPANQAGSTSSGIFQFIKGFYEANPGLTYVLLVGDHEYLPTHTYGLSWGGEELWSDSYYAQLEGNDFFPEVLIGRFSGNPTEVSLMVNRTLEYEKTPMEGDWMTRVIGIASEEGEGFGDDGQIDWQHLRGVGDLLSDNGYTYVHEFYEGSQGLNDAPGNPSAAMISDALNQGAGLLNYCGHGDQNIMVTGFYSTNDVNDLQNNGQYPFVVSVACNNGTFTNGTSICEAWLRSSNNGSPAGAIAACGSSILMAWAEPMQAQDEIASLITHSNPVNEKSTLGGLFFNGLMSILEDYSLSPTAIEVMQTWIFFGDPSVVYRNEPSAAITASHLPSIESSVVALLVTSDVEGAFVAITQNGEIIGTGVVSGGQVIVALGEFIPGLPLTVTVTAQNHTPYQGIVTTGALGTNDFELSDIRVYPNPANDHVTVRFDAPGTVELDMRDITGKLVYKSGSTSISGAGHQIDTGKFASGIYLLSVKHGERKTIKKIVIN